MKKIHLNEEFSRLWEKIENHENFTLLRYGDGERAIMVGDAVHAQEGWKAPNHITNLGYALQDTLNIDDPKVFYGISCPCCDRNAYYWYATRIASKNRTFANLWVNKNYAQFAEKIKTVKRDAVLIANHKAKNKNIGQFNILKHYAVGDNCVEFWDNDAVDFIEEIKKDFGHKSDLLYLISAGPLSEPIIVELFKNNPENCYIDFGSCLDIFIHGQDTRPYMDPNSRYAKSNCYMENPKTENFDVSIVLNLFKRPETLMTQIEALENQSLKPKEILIFQDAVPSGEKIPFPEMVKAKCDHFKISEENVGVWGRFRFADQAQSKYVCVFDDDTIPGSRWLENCHSEMMQREGLYGTNGILMFTPESYPKKMMSIGWKTQNKNPIEVDFVGHSWFFKKAWLKDLYQAPQEVQDMKICGEDMSFSFMLLKNKNIKTFVPPHPARQKYHTLYGSLPEHGYQFGADQNALCVNKDNLKKYNKAMNMLLNHQWDVALERYPVKKILCNIVKFIAKIMPHKKLSNSFQNIIIHKIMSYF